MPQAYALILKDPGGDPEEGQGISEIWRRCSSSSRRISVLDILVVSVEEMFFNRWLSISKRTSILTPLCRRGRGISGVPGCLARERKRGKCPELVEEHFLLFFNAETQATVSLSSTCVTSLTSGVSRHMFTCQNSFEGSWWSGRVAVMENIETISHWEASAAGAIIQHMAPRRLLKICFSGVSDISATISLIDVVKYAPSVSEL